MGFAAGEEGGEGGKNAMDGDGAREEEIWVGDPGVVDLDEAFLWPDSGEGDVLGGDSGCKGDLKGRCSERKRSG